MDAGAGGSGSDPGTPGFGMWHFDDCSASSHFLRDSSGFGANAQQALNAACVAGISNLGVRIRGTKDVVQVPDQPQFTVSKRVAVAAWVNPDNVSGDQPIVIKRLDKQTSFSLGIHDGNIEMSVVLTNGKTIISSAPISPGVWTHVAGMYDGTFVFLFINGQQFGQVFGGGDLRNVFAPLRFGATTSTQFLHGVIDEVFVSTEEISKDVLTALSCVSRPSTFTVSPHRQRSDAVRDQRALQRRRHQQRRRCLLTARLQHFPQLLRARHPGEHHLPAGLVPGRASRGRRPSTSVSTCRGRRTRSPARARSRSQSSRRPRPCSKY